MRISKSSEAERERMKPLERKERVCGEEPYADAIYIPERMEKTVLRPMVVVV